MLDQQPGKLPAPNRACGVAAARGDAGLRRSAPRARSGRPFPTLAALFDLERHNGAVDRCASPSRGRRRRGAAAARSLRRRGARGAVRGGMRAHLGHDAAGDGAEATTVGPASLPPANVPRDRDGARLGLRGMDQVLAPLARLKAASLLDRDAALACAEACALVRSRVRRLRDDEIRREPSEALLRVVKRVGQLMGVGLGSQGGGRRGVPFRFRTGDGARRGPPSPKFPNCPGLDRAPPSVSDAKLRQRLFFHWQLE